METSRRYKLKISQKIYLLIKSVLDFIIALIALIVLSPLFIIVAIAIKIDSPGPVFFVQKRIGKNGKLFNCIKFRSMTVDANHNVASVNYAEVKDHITRVGRVIRKFSLDELPQLFCILTFKMSLIGYRPLLACEEEIAELRKQYDVYRIRPGISGWAQVNGRDILATNPNKKAEYDAYYVEHVSIWLDIKIFFMTIIKVLSCEDVVEGVIDVSNDSCEEEQSFSNEVAVADAVIKDTFESVDSSTKKEVV